MSSERGTRRRCLEQYDRSGRLGRTDHRFTGMTVLDVVGSVDELADGMGGSVDAVTGAAIGPYRESRLRQEVRDATG